MTARFITVEGIEGVGKTTIIGILKEWFANAGLPHTFTREPGGTPIAEEIRTLLLQRRDNVMSFDTELLLMFAARAQHIHDVIQPALQRGEWVVSDRFTDASYAYQGGGRGIPMDRIAHLEQWVQGDLQPQLTILLDAPLAIAFARASSRSLPDRIEAEGKDFFERVRLTYLERARTYAERFVVIDASVELSQVKHAVLHALRERVEQL